MVPGAYAVGVAGLLLLASVAVPIGAHAQTEGQTWEPRASLPTARAYFAAAALAGKIYVAGGLVPSISTSTVLATVEVYDPAQDRWQGAADLPTPRWGLTLIAASDRLLAAGGSSDPSAFAGESAVVEVYDPASDTWSGAAPLPAPRMWAAGFERAGSAQFWGGAESGGASAVATRWSYNIALDQWTVESPMPLARSNFGATVIGNTVYLTGGWRNLPNTTAYDFATLSWTEKAPLSEGRAAHGAADLGGHVYAIAGVTAATTECAPSNEARRYDPSADRWSNGPALPEAVTAPGAVRVGEALYVIGGSRCQDLSTGLYALASSSGTNPPSVVSSWLIVGLAAGIVAAGVAAAIVFALRRRRPGPPLPP